MAAATAVLAFPPVEALAISDSDSRPSPNSRSSEQEEAAQLQAPLEIVGSNAILPSAKALPPDWKVPSEAAFEVSSVESEFESSSLDSFQLTESPDATTISTSSHRSSLSSLNGVGHKSRSVKLQWPKSPKSPRGPAASPIMRPLTANRKSEYHELKDQLSKFNARQGPAKANYLRLSLLTFLRKHRAYLMPSAFEQDFPLVVLGAWYDQLLTDVSATQKFVNASDKNAYYEGISGLMARPEWLDHQHESLYQSLLRRTLIHTLFKSSTTPNLPVAQAAHLGKVMAFAYMYIPGVAEYLLKTLNIKRETVMRFMSLHAKPENQSPQLVGVPTHLQKLVNLRAVPCTAPSPQWLSSVPEKSWVRHWHAESGVFASFFKHVCNLQTQFFPIMNPLGVGSAEGEEVDDAEALVLSAPGMILLLSALVENFDTIVSQSNRALGTRSGNPYARRTVSSTGSPAGRVRINQIKCFSVFREILHSDDATLLYFTSFCRAFDRVVRASAIRCEVYDMDSCVTICDLAEEWMSSIFLVPSGKSEQHILANHYRILDWRFWLTVAQRMLKSDNCHTEIRALSFLFNIWPNIPGYCRGGQTNDVSHLKLATDWLLLPETFLQLFCHWSPLVRSYYHRILCYRIASVGIDAESWFLDVESAEYYSESRNILTERFKYLMLWCSDLINVTNTVPSMAPSLPVPRMRIAIRPNAAQQAATHRIESGLSRLYPYDVFDNAAYWLPEPTHPSRVELKRQTSVSSKASVQSSATGLSVMSGRSACTASTGISESSFTSTDSDKSEMSVSSQSSRSSRLSLTGLVAALPFSSGKKLTPESLNDEVELSPVEPASGPDNIHDSNKTCTNDKNNNNNSTLDSTDEGIASSFKKRWSFFKALLPGKNTEKGATGGTSNAVATPESALEHLTPTTPNGSGKQAVTSDASSMISSVKRNHSNCSSSSGKTLASSRTKGHSNAKQYKLSKQQKQLKTLERKRTLRMNKKREQHEAAQAAVPLPPQLAEQRPEISRAPFRFVLIPSVGSTAAAENGPIAAPRLPFSAPIRLNEESAASDFRANCTDLAVWNYGFRSLAEWDVTVKMFEGFATQERERANGNIEMLQVPFLVAEIPWRVVG